MPVPLPVGQLGAEFKRIRKHRALSLRDVAEQTKISASTLSRLERGSTPDFDVIDRIADWLNVSVVSGATPDRQPKTDEEVMQVVEVHLRANKKLPNETARAIAEAVKLLLGTAGGKK
jgi:transcriptional regulator with XRE-family HTH domain